jgi:hypothetical protein
VIEQSIERERREIELNEQEYEQRLAEARAREARMKKMAQARTTKRMVRLLSRAFYALINLSCFRSGCKSPLPTPKI